jgi:RHS repeat-associated protein
VLSVTDPLGHTTSTAYDALNRPTQTTDANGGVSSIAYDALGNTIRQTDANGNTTHFVYDALNRPVQQTDAAGNTALFAYDAVGNLTQTTDRDGRVRTFSYDATNDRVGETWLQGGVAIYHASYSYDAVGNLVSASDSNSSYQMTYDALDQQTSIANAGTPGQSQVVLTSTYDAVGNLTQVQDNSGVTVQDAYNSRDLLTSQTWSGDGIAGAQVTYQYDAAGQQTEVDRFSDTSGTSLASRSQFTFDAAGRLTGLAYQDPNGNTLVTYQYQYDAAGRLIQEGYHGHTWQYTYDKIDELTGVSEDGASTSQTTYDAGGNRSNGTTVGTDNRLLSDGTFTYTYDNEGNLISKTSIADGSVTTYTYDFRNRLVGVIERSASGTLLHQIAYTYDVFDRRIAQVVDGVQTEYVYNGSQVWADYAANGTVLARYLDGLGQDQLVARWQPATGTAWYLTDHQGTVRDIANASGQIIDHIDYDAYGNVLAETNAAAGDRFKYAGKALEAITGLYDYAARWYDPRLGRFLSQDPLGWAAGQTNAYAYVGNSPVNFTDATGLAAASEYRPTVPVVPPFVGKYIECLAASLTLAATFAWALGNEVTPLEIVISMAGCTFPALDAANATAKAELQALKAELQAARAALPNCFPAGTPVLTETGSQRIEEVRSGEKVWSFDFTVGRWVLCHVETCQQSLYEGEFLRLELDDGDRLEVTADHPFWVLEGERLAERGPLRRDDAYGESDRSLLGRWVNSHELRVGDRIYTRLGSSAVTGIVRWRDKRSVYNLSVLGRPFYAVGDAGLLVHNSNTYVVNRGLPPGLPPYALNNPNGRVTGLLIFQEGGQTSYIRLTSGVNNATNAGLAGARNLPGATFANWHHVEFQALEIMQQRGITNAALLHNYPTGLPCGACMPGGDLTRLQSSLASGSQLSIFGLVPSPAGSTSPWIVSPAGSVRVFGTWYF